MKRLYFFAAIFAGVFSWAGYAQATFVVPANTVIFDTRPTVFPLNWDLNVEQGPGAVVDTRAEQTYIPPVAQTICALAVFDVSENTTGTDPWSMRVRIVQSSLSALSQNSYSRGDAAAYPATSTIEFYWDPCLVLSASSTATIRFERQGANMGAGNFEQLLVGQAATSSLTLQVAPILSSRNLNTSAVVTSSRPLPFILYGSGATSYFEEPSASAYGFTAGAASGTDFGLFGNMLRDLLLWVFVPSDSVLSGVGNYMDDLKLRVPFGYFASVSSTFEGIGDDTTTSTQIILYASSTTSTLSAVIFDPVQLQATIPPGILSLIKTLAGVAMWAMLFLFVFRKATGAGELSTDEDV